MPRCHLIFVRHGHTAGNAPGAKAPMSGRTDVPLSHLGRCEADALGRRLAGGMAYDAVYSSPLARARETIRIALGSLRRVRFHDGLREIDCGDVDGMPIGEVEARHPAFWQANLRQDDDHFHWPSGETYHELRDRCLAAVHAIAATHADQRVVVVTHAGVISQVLCAVHGIRAARWEPFRPSNASFTWVDWQGDEGALLRFDDRRHLGGRIDREACVAPHAPR